MAGTVPEMVVDSKFVLVVPFEPQPPILAPTVTVVSMSAVGGSKEAPVPIETDTETHP
jgi:hypothetical protein